MALSNGMVQNGAVTPLDARMMDAARVVRTAAGVPRSGVLWTSASTGNVIGSTTSMNVNVVSADFVLSRSASDGAVIVSNNGAVTVALDAAPSANSRIDVVWVKQNDSAAFGDADSRATFGKTTGTAAAQPSKPSIPSGAMELGTVTVPAGALATNASGVTITNTFQYTALSGSPVRYRTDAARIADAANVSDGTYAYVTSGDMWVMRTSGWKPVSSNAASSYVRNPTSWSNSTTTLGTVASLVLPTQPYDQQVTVSGCLYLSSVGASGNTATGSITLTVDSGAEQSLARVPNISVSDARPFTASFIVAAGTSAQIRLRGASNTNGTTVTASTSTDLTYLNILASKA